MPTYHYSCSECGNDKEIRQKITDEALKICPICKKETFSRGPGGGQGFLLKGSGYYITDYCRKDPVNSTKECCPCAKSGSDTASCKV